MIKYNKEFNDKILEVLKVCKCNYQKYLKSGKTKQHEDLRYLYKYIFDCTSHLDENLKFSNRIFWVLNEWQNWPKCEYCGKELILPNNNKGFRLKIKDGKLVYNWPRHCCNKCAQLDPKTKFKQRCVFQEKYGCDNPFQSEEIKAKCRKKHIENYGVDVPFKSEKVRNKYINTMIQKYGVKNSFQLQISKDAANSEEAKLKRNNSLSSYNMEKFGVPWFVMSDEFKEKNNIENGTSKEEKELFEFLKTITNYEIIVGSFKIISPKQLDFFIPELKIAFEFNGTYFHSFEYLKDMNYHLNKTKMCEQKEIKLIHIWEDEWLYDKKQIKQLIKNIINGNIIFSDKILKLDRSKFNKCWISSDYILIEETDPKLILRSKRNKLKYLVPDCGKIIFKKI